MRPVGDLIMALIVVTEPDPRKAIITMFRRTGLALLPLSMVLIKYFHTLGKVQDKHWGADSWSGVATHKNTLGQLCMASALGFIWTLLESRRNGQSLKKQRLLWFYLLLAAYLFVGGGPQSRSTTSMFCLALALALFFLLGKMRDKVESVGRRIMGGIVALCVVAAVLQASGTSLQAVTAEAQGKNPDLTGRTFLWADVVRLGMRHPFLGTGYGNFWVRSIYSELSPEVDNKPAEAHNGYLETFANLGLVGVGLLLIMILQSLRSALRELRVDFEYGRMRLALLFVVAVMNYSEATFPRGTHLWWFGFLIFAISAGPAVSWQAAPQAMPVAAPWAQRPARSI
jgi:O-antigen ligase